MTLVRGMGRGFDGGSNYFYNRSGQTFLDFWNERPVQFLWAKMKQKTNLQSTPGGQSSIVDLRLLKNFKISADIFFCHYSNRIRHSPQLCTSSTYTASSWKQNIKTRFASKTLLINAKRGSISSILCLMLVSLEFLGAAPQPFLCINNLALCPWSLALDSLSARLLQT
jgi:hypothetical protein